METVPLNMRFGFNDRKPQARGTGFKFVGGLPVDPAVSGPKVTRGEVEFAESMRAKQLAETLLPPTSTGEVRLPHHVRNARRVLRFNGYFKEAVHESAVENHRIRRVTFLFYLEDGTLQVNEDKMNDSGIPQGTFMKRHKCPRENGGVVGPEDFHIGGDIRLYGRTFRVSDCDQFTREWYSENGTPQPAPLDVPADSYTTLRETSKARDTGADSTVFRGKQANPLKRFMEASLGNASNVQRCGVHDPLRQFLDNDGKVLRFFAVWDDRASTYGDRLFFRVHYFLADDTMEIMEQHSANSGRDKFPALLKRQRVSRKVMLTDDRTRGIEDDNGEGDYYNHDDLCVGTTINILGRDLLLFNADDFTMQWYREVKGLDMSGAVVDVEERKPPAPKPAPPPPTGFGSEEDSLASCGALMPKPPKKDFHKMTAYEGKVLRFTAKLANAAPLDVTRDFLVAFYLTDDTVAVFETAKRNSGIIGGKWLAQSRVTNAVTGTYFKKTDFYIGAAITLRGVVFTLETADEFTLSTMEADPASWPLSQLARAVAATKEAAAGKLGALSSALGEADAEGRGSVTPDAFVKAFAAAGVAAPRQALVTIARNLVNDEGRIPYERLRAALA